MFVADTQNARVLELPAGGSQQTLPFSGLTAPADVAADAAGDVFVADAPTGRVVELPAGGSQQTLPFSGLSDPEAVAVDAAGDVFVADAGNMRVVELPAGGTQQTLPSTGLNGPEGVAVDGAGDVFVADSLNSRVVELPAGGTQQTLPFSGLSEPDGVTVDLAGNVFVADTGHGRVVKLSPSLTSGSFGLSPATGASGSSIGLASVTPCTLFSGGAFAATEAKLLLYSSTGQLLESATAPFGDLGSWGGRAACSGGRGGWDDVRRACSLYGLPRRAGAGLSAGDVHGAGTGPGEARADPVGGPETDRCEEQLQHWDQGSFETLVHVHVHLRGTDGEERTGDSDREDRRSSPGDRARPDSPPQAEVGVPAPATRALHGDADRGGRARQTSCDRTHDHRDQLSAERRAQRGLARC